MALEKVRLATLSEALDNRAAELESAEKDVRDEKTRLDPQVS